jgi:hypothetical protein
MGAHQRVREGEGERGRGGVTAGGARGEGGMLGERSPWGCMRSSVMRSALFGPCSLRKEEEKKREKYRRKGREKGKQIPNLQNFRKKNKS